MSGTRLNAGRIKLAEHKAAEIGTALWIDCDVKRLNDEKDKPLLWKRTNWSRNGGQTNENGLAANCERN